MSSLGEAYLRNGEGKKAVSTLEGALALLDKGSPLLREILPLLYEAKELK